MEGAVVVLAVVTLGWVAVSAWLASHNVTPAMTFLVAGLAVALLPGGRLVIHPSSQTLRLLAEYALALLLFTDASRVSFAWLRRRSGAATRLLLIGLPLTIALGVGLALALPLGTGAWVAAVIGASLAPTDAALGASILTDRRLPSRLRTTLNVESGLNDGLATPVVLFCISAATASADHTSVSQAVTGALGDLVVGVAAGMLIGGGGGRLMVLAGRRGWLDPAASPLGVLGLAVLAYAGTTAAGGNGFVACFIAGMAFGNVLRRSDSQEVELVEGLGSLLAYAVWFAFGVVLVTAVLDRLTWAVVVYGVLSLTAVRMIPSALALIGSRWSRPDVLVVGWMGPRGLASVVFALLAFDSLGPSSPAAQDVIEVVGFTVLLSVFAHGLLAGPVAAAYAVHAPATQDDDEPAPRAPVSLGAPARTRLG
jgi:NhaP-type Na+/H+ or K+/H+ antiporter